MLAAGTSRVSFKWKDMHMIKSLLCAAALVAAPMVASAAVVEPGAVGSDATLLGPGVTSFVYEPTEATTIAFTITAMGLDQDIAKISYGFTPDAAASTALSSTPISPGLSFGLGIADSIWGADPVTLYLFNGGTLAAPFVTVAYAAGDAIPAPIPVPAAGGMLLLAMAGMGVAAARRRK